MRRDGRSNAESADGQWMQERPVLSGSAGLAGLINFDGARSVVGSAWRLWRKRDHTRRRRRQPQIQESKIRF